MIVCGILMFLTMETCFEQLRSQHYHSQLFKPSSTNILKVHVKGTMFFLNKDHPNVPPKAIEHDDI